MYEFIQNREGLPVAILPGPRVLVGRHAYPIPATEGLALAGMLARESFRGLAEEIIAEDAAKDATP